MVTTSAPFPVLLLIVVLSAAIPVRDVDARPHKDKVIEMGMEEKDNDQDYSSESSLLTRILGSGEGYFDDSLSEEEFGDQSYHPFEYQISYGPSPPKYEYPKDTYNHQQQPSAVPAHGGYYCYPHPVKCECKNGEKELFTAAKPTKGTYRASTASNVFKYELVDDDEDD